MNGMDTETRIAECGGIVAAPTEASPPPIRLESPSEIYRESFFAAMAEFASEGAPQVSPDLTREGFPAYVQRLHDHAAGRNLPEGYIPSKEFWIVDEEGYAGRIILGLAYYPSPERVGNHVGYIVRPSKRRRGYATEALRSLLAEARRLEIPRLMLVCDEDNVASRKVIEKNGGTFLGRLPNDEVHHGALRFLIDLTPTSRSARTETTA